MKDKNTRYKMLSMTVASILMFSTIAYGAEPITKDESVYVNLTAEGEHKQTIVSDWLHSDKAGIEIKDKSILESITNIKGDETPDIQGDTLIWKSHKNDIYYQGVTDKPLPLQVRITYSLDGKEVKPEEMGGKSGHLKLTIRFINNDSHVVSINGKDQTIYTPFTTSAMVNLPLDTFTNVKASTGEIVSDANNQMVTFIGFPGLQESLGIDRDVIDIPEEISIEAEVKNFHMGPIMIVATPKIPDVDKFEGAEDIDELVEGIEKMNDAASQLTDGANKLADGQVQLADGIDTFSSGMGKLKDASGAINGGAAQLAQGTKDALNGSTKLSDGVTAMGQGVDQFGNAAFLFGKGAQDYSKGAKDYANGATEFAGQLAPLTEKIQELGNGLNAMVDNTTKIISGQEQVTAGAKEGAKGIEGLKAAKGQQNAGIKAVADGLENAIHELKATPGTEKTVMELTAYQQILNGILHSKPQFDGGLDQLQSGFQAIQTGSAQLTAGLNELQKGHVAAATGVAQMGDASKELGAAVQRFNEGSKGLAAGANELAKNAERINNGAGQFHLKMKEFGAGFDEFNAGMASLSKGASALYQGTTEFDQGLQTASNGAMDLRHGAEALSSGSIELATNMEKFKREAIDKLDEEINSKTGNIQDVLSAKDEVVKRSKDYETFSGIDENMQGSVKFIMKTDEIKAPEVEEKETIETKHEKDNFWNWIKNLFNKK